MANTVNVDHYIGARGARPGATPRAERPFFIYWKLKRLYSSQESFTYVVDGSMRATASFFRSPLPGLQHSDYGTSPVRSHILFGGENWQDTRLKPAVHGTKIQIAFAILQGLR